MVRLKWGGAGAGLPAIPRQTPKAWPSLVGHLAHNILVEGYGYWVWTSLLGGLAGLNSILMKVNIVSKEDPGWIPTQWKPCSALYIVYIVYNCIQLSTSKCTSAEDASCWVETLLSVLAGGEFPTYNALVEPGNPHTGQY